jgi:hypothetical protein
MAWATPAIVSATLEDPRGLPDGTGPTCTLDRVSSSRHYKMMGEVRPRWAKLPPAERERRIAQSTADRARAGGQPEPAPVLPEPERRHRQSQSAIDQARAARWADLPEDERRRRQSQSDGDRAAAAGSAHVTELENDETLQAMWNTVENGGYDFMSKDDW